MTIRFLKQDKESILGKNGKKLMYDYDKINKKVTCKNKSNWTEYAEDIIEEMYDDCEFIWEEKKRGRPGKTKTQKPKRKNKTLTRKDKKTPKKTAATCDTSDEEDITHDDYCIKNKNKKKKKIKNKFVKGKRVKIIDKLEMGIGEIKAISKKEVIVSFDKNLIKTTLYKLQGVRGRAPKKKQIECNDSDSEEEKSDFCNEDLDDIEWIKIEGDLYLINKKDEVSNLHGDYIGIYRNNVLFKI